MSFEYYKSVLEEWKKIDSERRRKFGLYYGMAGYFTVDHDITWDQKNTTFI